MAVTETQINLVNALVASQYPNNTYVHSHALLAEATVPASAGPSVNSGNANLTSPNGSKATSTNIPFSQVWVIKDIYITSTSSDPLDATIEFNLNGVKTLLVSDPLSANLISNNSRPGLALPLLIAPNAALSLPTYPLTANGTSIVTDTFFISVTIFDSTFS
jgi:hypothetical protein